MRIMMCVHMYSHVLHVHVLVSRLVPRNRNNGYICFFYYNKLPQIEGYRQQRWSYESVESETSPVALG